MKTEGSSTKGQVNCRDLCFVVRLRWIFPNFEFYYFPLKFDCDTYVLGKITYTKEESDINRII